MAEEGPDRSLLVKQFVLARAPTHLPDDWKVRELAGWLLATHAGRGLPVLPILANDGSRIGWVIGFPIDDEHGLLRCELRLPVDAGSTDLHRTFERHLYALAGRYCAVLLSGDVRRLYLDPCGSLAVVYSPQFEMACSTTSVLPAPDEARSDLDHRDLVATLDIPQHDRWYPFGLTARPDAERLIPNHYLDLGSWTAHRHWPSDSLQSIESPGGADDALQTVVQGIQRTIGHLTRAGVVSLSLTAGRDSRMLAACARPYREHIEFTTTRHGDRTGRIDCRIAKLIADRHDLKHSFVEWKESSPEELALWQFRVGHCIAGRTWQAARSASFESRGAFHVTGHAGETGRTFYWRDGDLGRNKLRPEEIVKRLYLPAHELILRRCESWSAGLGHLPLPTRLDLLYLEQRVGCWATLMYYGHVGPMSFIIPFNDRRIIDAFLRLPFELRLSEGLPEAVIDRAWPELLDIPFNQFLGLEAIVDRGLAPVRRFGRNHPRLRRALAWPFTALGWPRRR